MDGRKLSSYKIYDGATVNLVVRPQGRAAQDIGSDIMKLYPGLLDPKYDCDFTKAAGDTLKYMRGGVQYMRPIGWKRLALKLDKYGSDLAWIGGVRKGTPHYYVIFIIFMQHYM